MSVADKFAISGAADRAKELYVRVATSKTMQAANHPAVVGQEGGQGGVTAILLRLFRKDEFI